MKKLPLITAMVALGLSSFAHAVVIELDTLNANHCRQQLTQTGGDAKPIVMIYFSDCFWAKQVRPVYERVSSMYPRRIMFAFNAMDSYDTARNPTRMRVAMQCLGTTPYKSPVFAEMSVAPALNIAAGEVIGIGKMGLDGSAKEYDFINFFNLNQIGLQTAKYTLAK